VASPYAVVLATMPPLLAVIANAGRHVVLVRQPAQQPKVTQRWTVRSRGTGRLRIPAAKRRWSRRTRSGGIRVCRAGRARPGRLLSPERRQPPRFRQQARGSQPDVVAGAFHGVFDPRRVTDFVSCIWRISTSFQRTSACAGSGSRSIRRIGPMNRVSVRRTVSPSLLMVS